ncbi:MAG: DinB family protein [Candidatus Dormibacteria bacterium]
MSEAEIKEKLHEDLQEARDAVIWKLEGLPPFQVRRPMVPTGTNLIGVVKHLAIVESGYLGATFGRPFQETERWFGDDYEPNSDMWASAEETPESIVDLYRRVWAHSDATLRDLDLDTIGHVPWWDPGNRVTLLRITVYMIAETNRHAGHSDIVRELIDGSAGWRRGDDSMPSGDPSWWDAYRRRLEEAAEQAEAG